MQEIKPKLHFQKYPNMCDEHSLKNEVANHGSALLSHNHLVFFFTAAFFVAPPVTPIQPRTLSGQPANPP